MSSSESDSDSKVEEYNTWHYGTPLIPGEFECNALHVLQEQNYTPQLRDKVCAFYTHPKYDNDPTYNGAYIDIDDEEIDPHPEWTFIGFGYAIIKSSGWELVYRNLYFPSKDVVESWLSGNFVNQLAKSPSKYDRKFEQVYSLEGQGEPRVKYAYKRN